MAYPPDISIAVISHDEATRVQSRSIAARSLWCQEKKLELASVGLSVGESAPQHLGHEKEILDYWARLNLGKLKGE